MRSTKVAILGGSFDPVHLGHLFLLHCAISMTDYNSFILIPAKVSNFKQDNSPKASDQDRMNMLSLALEDYRELYPQDSDKEISISDIELKRGGVSYTSDTIKELKASLGDSAQIAIVMGDDHVKSLSKWHEFEYLRDNVEFLVCRRYASGDVWTELPEGVCYKKLEVPESAPQSSSAIRENRDSNMSYLSRRVADYVKEHNLYT